MPKMRLPKSAFTGKQAETPNVADFAGMGEVTLLSKAKTLENLLNHVEDLKGTPFEEAAAYLAEKAPWVFGHIGKIDAKIKNPSWLGSFTSPKIHDVVGKNLKDVPIGDISLNPNMLGKSFNSDAASTLAHEVTHGAQALMKGAARSGKEYDRANSKLFGYLRNPMEHGANKVGRKVAKAVKLRRR